MDTVTERLVLHPLSLDEILALSHRQKRPGELWAPEYPSFDEVGFFEAYVLDTPRGRSWTSTMYQIRLRDTGMAIGGIGLISSDSVTGQVEIGFGIEPSMRRMGYASEAVAGVVQICRDHLASSIVASTGHGNTTAHHVLVTGGLSEVGRDAELVYFAVQLRPAPSR